MPDRKSGPNVHHLPGAGVAPAAAPQAGPGPAGVRRGLVADAVNDALFDAGLWDEFEAVKEMERLWNYPYVFAQTIGILRLISQRDVPNESSVPPRTKMVFAALRLRLVSLLSKKILYALPEEYAVFARQLHDFVAELEGAGVRGTLLTELTELSHNAWGFVTAAPAGES